LRDYLSWKNQIFKQNFINNISSDVDYSKLFNCTKNKDGEIEDTNLVDLNSLSKRKTETEAKTEGN
jgi:hypothetical protein